MNTRQPGIGDWYRHRGELFEVVAVDEDDGLVEVQSFDGTIEEIEIADWHLMCSSGAIEPAEAPEDTRGSLDGDSERESGDGYDPLGDERRTRSSGGIDGLDLFE